jgi:hypothetical protein
MRSTKTIAIALAAATLALVAACGDDKGSTSGATGSTGKPTTAAASPTPSAKDVLSAALKSLSTSTYTYTMKIAEGTVTGAVDPAGKQQAKLDGAASGVKFSIEGIVMGADYYFKTSVPATGINTKKWYKLDRTKVTKDEIVGLFEAKDPTGSQELISRVGTATQDSPTSISGTYDLTKGGDLGIEDSAAITALGDKAKAAPFAATLDAQKNLTSIKITIPAYGTTVERTVAVDYAGHGQPVAIAAPKAADVTPATTAVYTFLNS